MSELKARLWLADKQNPRRNSNVRGQVDKLAFEEGTFKPAAKITDENKYSIITDYLGTPTQMYDEQGKLSWEAEFDIYGKVHNFAGSSLNDCPFRYQGQYEDSETGLFYNRFRYYSPEEGMYISQDPIGLEGKNPTIYAYVKNPNSWVDELGLNMTQWGWSGTKIWKDLVNEVSQGGTKTELLGKIATESEAIKLIKEAGGKINRIEGPYLPPNPHTYDHINYTTSKGKKGTIKIQCT